MSIVTFNPTDKNPPWPPFAKGGGNAMPLPFSNEDFPDSGLHRGDVQSTTLPSAGKNGNLKKYTINTHFSIFLTMFRHGDGKSREISISTSSLFQIMKGSKCDYRIERSSQKLYITLHMKSGMESRHAISPVTAGAWRCSPLRVPWTSEEHLPQPWISNSMNSSDEQQQ